MKKPIALFLILVLFIIFNGSVAMGENIVSLMHNGARYTAVQAAAPNSGYPYSVSNQGDSVKIADGRTGIQADVERQRLDDEIYSELRSYYNDESLSDSELFKKFIELKKSYINALQTHYDTNYLNTDKKADETTMHIYYKGTDRLFGQEQCSVYLYNIARYEGLSHSEQVHLDLIVPTPSVDTVITIRFVIPLEKFDTAVSEHITSMLSEMRFDGLSQQTGCPAVLSDKAVTGAARLGIYPAVSQTQPVYKLYSDSTAGFSVSMPDTYIPYIRNSLGGVFTYTSFKIDPNLVLSITSKPVQNRGLEDALIHFKVTASGSVKVVKQDKVKFGGNQYTLVSYYNSENNLKKYYYDYYIQDGTRLYTLQLQSSIEEPGRPVLAQMKAILSSFLSAGRASFVTFGQANPAEMASFIERYVNKEEGYSFSYPKSWTLENVSKSIENDRLKLVIPGLSGSLDVSVQESELKQAVNFNDVVKSVSGKTVTSWPNLSVNYNPPFKDKTSILLYSDFVINGPISTIYRLSAFMDDYGRNRLCYSADIIKGKKVYSLFITAGEYNTVSGQFKDPTINALLNVIASSFRLENTSESEARRISGETRNRKLVFVEEYLKRLIDSRLTVTSAEETQPDGTVYVTVANCSESGYYKINLDYPSRKVEILDIVLKRNILKNELSAVEEMHSGKIITKAQQNEDTMTVAVESRENTVSARVTRVYRVDVSLKGGKITWNLTRLAHQEDYEWECGLYVKSMMKPGAKVYFSDKQVFKDIAPFRTKGLPYRLMVYARSQYENGFMLLSMNPTSSLFTASSNFIPLQRAVEEISVKYGFDRAGKVVKEFSFDPDLFVMSLKVSDDKTGLGVQEHYKIFYNPDIGMMDYQKLK